MRAIRALVLIHRYLGIAVGILMVGWCLSGIVMMYVSYPELSPAERLRGLVPLDWKHCCVLPDQSLADNETVAGFSIEELGDEPVLRVRLASGTRRLIDLADGRSIVSVPESLAMRVAAQYRLHEASRTSAGAPSAKALRLDSLIDHDPWTVSGSFDSDRPLYRFALRDPAQTVLYVSARTGEAVQVTTAHERFWNWLGAIPHWLYFTELRRNTALWSQVVIWTSLIGSVLALTGVYLGFDRLVRAPGGAWSPYRGMLLWHHVPGVLFGLFVLTWIASGLLSMNPWGLLEGSGAEAEIRQLEGGALSGAQVKASLRALAAASLPAGTVSIQSAPLLGKLYFIARGTDATRTRVDATGAPAPLTRADAALESKILSGAQTRSGAQRAGGPIPELELITQEDAYDFTHHRDTALLPAYRLVLNDAHRTRYYLDPVSGEIVAKIDSGAREYRWLHQGLHRMDFTRTLRSRPLWDFLMLALLSGVTLVCGTGTYLGMRRLTR